MENSKIELMKIFEIRSCHNRDCRSCSRLGEMWRARHRRFMNDIIVEIPFKYFNKPIYFQPR